MSIIETVPMDRKSIKQRLWNPPNAIREEGECRRLTAELDKMRGELRATRHNLELAFLTIQEQAEQLLLSGAKPSETEDLVAKHFRQNTFKGVAGAVSEHFGIGIRDIMSRTRLFRIVYARHICFYVARKVIKISLPEIGRRMGCDHTTVLHGVRKIEAQLSDLTVLADIDAVKARLARVNPGKQLYGGPSSRKR